MKALAMDARAPKAAKAPAAAPNTLTRFYAVSEVKASDIPFKPSPMFYAISRPSLSSDTHKD